MNILVTFDANYAKYAGVMLRSLAISNPEDEFDVYVMNSALTDAIFKEIADYAAAGDRLRLHDVKVNIEELQNAPVTGRYPLEMYYRIFAAKFLPEDMDRILYLDPDLVVLNPVKKLYEMDFKGAYFIASSHVGRFLRGFNEFRLGMEGQHPYINSGVMLINLELLRGNQSVNEVYDFIEEHKHVLFLPDQDIISSLYGSKILLVDAFVYNMSEKQYRRYFNKCSWLTINWIRDNTVFLHYCGRNKPWKPNYKGELNVFYKEIVRS